MIEHYSDHAANERTFLAWVRTAIAVMAFGFLVEKFDLFLEVASTSSLGMKLSERGQTIGNVAGLLLILLGGGMMLLAAIRFRTIARDIDDKETRPGTGSNMDLFLVSLLGLLGAVLFVYLTYTVVRRL